MSRTRDNDARQPDIILDMDPLQEGDTIVDREDCTDLKEPSKYKVILLDDDYTPMDWVVWVLEAYFGHNLEVAAQIMMQVHQNGHGIAGIYPFDIAETKSMLVNHVAQRDGYPLRTRIEEE